MKRFLNLNDFGGKAILVIGILGLGIPGVLYGISIALKAMGIEWLGLRSIMWGSLAAGGFLLVVFLVFLIFEQIQDHLLYKMYLKMRGKRIRTGENTFECPYCGNRRVKEFEYQCPVCGKTLSW